MLNFKEMKTMHFSPDSIQDAKEFDIGHIKSAAWMNQLQNKRLKITEI